MSLPGFSLAPPTSAHGDMVENTPTDKVSHLMEEVIRLQNTILQSQAEIADRHAKLLEQIANNGPAPQISPTKASKGWTPILSQIARNNIIRPDLDWWKDTLDTLLIFIALFSAIVTAFLVPALAELSQNPAERTNELLSNLTEIIIQTSQVEHASLTFSVASPFRPDPGAIRQIVFWSLSLLTSASIASVAVIQRTYPASIARFLRETEIAHDKLIGMLVRWKQSSRLLEPVVDLLPHILIVSVVLFIAGLLDTIFASAFALSPIPRPVIAAGAISSVVVGICGITIIHTICFGLTPIRVTFLHKDAVLELYRIAREAASLAFITRILQNLSTIFDRRSEPTTAMRLNAYRTMLLNTHDQNDAVQIAQALWGIAQYSLEEGNHVPPLPHSLEEGSNLPLWPHAKDFIQILVDLLLPQCGPRANLTCALATAKIYGALNMKQNKSIAQRSVCDSELLITTLYDTLTRYVSEISRTEVPQQLWTSAYMQALASILLPHSSEEECRDAHCILLLFAVSVPGLEDKLIRFKNLAASSLYHTLHVEGQDLKKTLSMLFGLFGDLQSHAIFSNPQNMTTLIDFWHADHSVTGGSQPQDIITVVQELFRFFCRRGLWVFVQAALRHAHERREDVPFVLCLLDSVALFRLRQIDTNPSSYSDIVSGVISLTENTISASAAMPSELRDSIIKVVRNMAERIKEKETWAREITAQVSWATEGPTAGRPSANGAVTKKMVVKGLVSAKWAQEILANVPVAKAILDDVDKATNIFADSQKRLEQLTVPDSNAPRGHLPPDDVHTVNEEARKAILAAFKATPASTGPVTTTSVPAAPVPAASAPAGPPSVAPTPAEPVPAGLPPVGARQAGTTPAAPAPEEPASGAPDQQT